MTTLGLIAAAVVILAVWLALAWVYTQTFGLVGWLLMPSPEMVGQFLTTIGTAIGEVGSVLGELVEGLSSALSGD